MERTLRGAGIGVVSMEKEDSVEPADQAHTVYHCAAGHTFIVPFAWDAEIPETWQCRCGSVACLESYDGDFSELQQERQRTHWDMLLERRTMAELEVLLDERLALLRSGRARLASA